MTDINKIISYPIFFERNRVNRVYVGGKPYPEFFGTNEEGDNMFPEEWIASTVKAINSDYYGPRDGVSIVRDTDLFFDDLMKNYSKELCGHRKYDCLIKILDSAIRLPVQVHPTKEFSRKHLNSDYGKTESWLVINKRPGAKMYFGFNNRYTKEYLMELEEKSENDKEIMASVCQSVDVEIGDLFIIPAGLIHAIGAGCTVIEVQEPTDFTIQPERWCGDKHLNYQEEFLSLDKETAMDCFDLDLINEVAISKAVIKPETLIKKEGYTKESLITYKHTTCFSENRHTVEKSEFTLDWAPAVYIVLEGEGELIGKDYNHKLVRGDYFFLPYTCEGKIKARSDSKLVLIECLPSMQK